MKSLAISAFLAAVCCGCFGRSQKNSEATPANETDPFGGINEKTEVKVLLERINDIPPAGRYTETPAVYELIARGSGVIPDVLPLMESEDLGTRLRAQRVLRGITGALHGFRPGKGWPDHQSEDQWLLWWKNMGGLDAESDKESRQRAIQLWKKWLATQRG